MKKTPARSSNPYLVLYEDAIKHASYRVKLEAEQVGKSWLDGYRTLLKTIEDYVWKLQELVSSDSHQRALVRLGTLKQKAASLSSEKPMPEDTKQQLLTQLDVLGSDDSGEAFD
jgi:hypothetical protein